MLLMANMVTEHLNSGWIPKPMGNEAQSGSPSSGLYKTKSSSMHSWLLIQMINFCLMRCS